MALAKCAPLLVLDEPVASLDPVARLEFMREVMAQAAGGGPTVIIASHVVSELERFCDFLVVLTHGHVQLAGPVDDLLEEHQLLIVPRLTRDADLPGTPIHRDDSDRHSSVLLRTSPATPPDQAHPDWRAESVGFEQLVLAYLQRPAKGGKPSNPAQGAEPSGPTTKVMSR
jgi:ABC-2 type transport system ATP-binding protein